jgi:hypothetical protein
MIAMEILPKNHHYFTFIEFGAYHFNHFYFFVQFVESFQAKYVFILQFITYFLYFG